MLKYLVLNSGSTLKLQYTLEVPHLIYLNDSGYYNCGYGCQWYDYNPGCIPCTITTTAPTTTTTTTTTPITTTTTTIVHDVVVITSAYGVGGEYPVIYVSWNPVAGASSYEFYSDSVGSYNTASTSVGGGLAHNGTNYVSVTAKFGGIPDYNTSDSVEIVI